MGMLPRASASQLHFNAAGIGGLMLQNTPCERCQRVGFVRLERIFTGNTLTLSYYCGECDHSWQTLTADQRQSGPGTVPPQKDRRHTA
jgi:hypothetical protein